MLSHLKKDKVKQNLRAYKHDDDDHHHNHHRRNKERSDSPGEKPLHLIVEEFAEYQVNHHHHHHTRLITVAH